MEHKKLLDKVLKELKRYKFVKAIYIFGSYAQKKNTPVSDIDICIIDDVRYSSKSRRKVYLYSENKFDISLFSDLPLQIRYEVFKGKCVSVTDKNYIAKLKEVILREYFDMLPVWRENLILRKERGEKVLSI